MELIVDQNKENTFCHCEYPLFSIDTSKPFSCEELKKLAAKIIKQSQNMRYIILKPSHENDMIYLLTLILRLEADKYPRAPACVVLKISDLNSSIELHKKYLALTAGTIYISRLAKMDADSMLKDIETLGYLGLDIKKDYLKNMMTLKLNGSGKEHSFTPLNKEKTILLSALMKTLSLLEIRPTIKTCIDIKKVQTSNNEIDTEKLIVQIIKITHSVIFNTY